MDYSHSMRSVGGETPGLPWSWFLLIASFSLLAVYCTSMSLYTIDVATGSVAATESLKLYREALAGARDFPYQWRLLGMYLVYAGERLTGFEPHAIDLGAEDGAACAPRRACCFCSAASTPPAWGRCARSPSINC